MNKLIAKILNLYKNLSLTNMAMDEVRVKYKKCGRWYSMSVYSDTDCINIPV